MDLKKEIQFSLEFVQRLIERDILSAFGGDLDEARKQIEWKMRHESVIIDNSNPKYPNQSWCIINIDKVGLAKIPIAETPKYVKAITIAIPVTDQMCIDSYNSV
ncbi:MAG: hypothetical protein AABX14_05440, partial [Candidatus Aenigmatarchaeota archaeon]